MHTYSGTDVVRNYYSTTNIGNFSPAGAKGSLSVQSRLQLLTLELTPPISMARLAGEDRIPPIFQNGSVAVDHFSAVGAKVLTDFMEDYVLLDGVKELFQ